MKKNLVVVKKVGKEPEILVVKDELEVYQKLVGGYIEYVSLQEGVSMIVNEEGKFNMQCKPNIMLPHLQDVAFGDVVFVAINEEEGESCNPTKEQLEYIFEYLNINTVSEENRKYLEIFRQV